MAGNSVKYVSIDAVIMQIPEKSTHKAEDIANFIKTKFSNHEEIVRAAFYWIAQNISYDVPAMYKMNFYDNDQQIIDQVLSSRKGVCMHYAMLFNRICNLAGVKSYWVGGYTRQNSTVAAVPHAWNVVNIYGKWQIIDPTWGAGHLINGKFVRELNNNFFDSKPDKMIQTHCPFDPMWQLLNFPISNSDFISGKSKADNKTQEWNFNDSIASYEKQDTITREIVTLKRMERNGIINNLLSQHALELKKNIENAKRNQSVGVFNEAVNTINEGINNLNSFISYRNNQFNPLKEDTEILQMLENVTTCINKTKQQIKNIKFKDASITNSIVQLEELIENTEKNLAEQKTFLDKYLSTPKLLRKTLFYKITIVGKPIN